MQDPIGGVAVRQVGRVSESRGVPGTVLPTSALSVATGVAFASTVTSWLTCPTLSVKSARAVS
jgi:hypothetical protein